MLSMSTGMRDTVRRQESELKGYTVHIPLVHIAFMRGLREHCRMPQRRVNNRQGWMVKLQGWSRFWEVGAVS